MSGATCNAQLVRRDMRYEARTTPTQNATALRNVAAPPAQPLRTHAESVVAASTESTAHALSCGLAARAAPTSRAFSTDRGPRVAANCTRPMLLCSALLCCHRSTGAQKRPSERAKGARPEPPIVCVRARARGGGGGGVELRRAPCGTQAGRAVPQRCGASAAHGGGVSTTESRLTSARTAQTAPCSARTQRDANAR